MADPKPTNTLSTAYPMYSLFDERAQKALFTIYQNQDGELFAASPITKENIRAEEAAKRERKRLKKLAKKENK